MAIRIFFMVVLLSIAFGCKSPKVITLTETVVRDSIIVREIPRKIIVKEPADTSYVVTLIECDSVTNKPIPVKASGKGIRSQVKVMIDNVGLLTATGICDSLHTVITAKDKEITRLRTTSTVTVESKIVYKARWYDKIFRWTALATAVYVILKVYFKFTFI